MPTIRIDDEVFQALKGRAEPLVDNPNSVLRRILQLDQAHPSADNGLLRAQGPGCSSLGRDLGVGFEVLAGSKARLSTTKTIPDHARKLRSDLVRSGVLVEAGQEYEFTRDMTFDSPSAAACVVLGRSANGLQEWRTADGRTLAEVRSQDR